MGRRGIEGYGLGAILGAWAGTTSPATTNVSGYHLQGLSERTHLVTSRLAGGRQAILPT